MIVRPRQKKASARLERRESEKVEKNGFPKSPKIGFFGVFGVLPCGYRAKCQNAEKRTFRAHTRDTACPRFWQKRVTSRFFDDFSLSETRKRDISKTRFLRRFSRENF